MKLFQRLRESFGRAGIYPLQSAEKFACFNLRNVTVVILMNVFIVSSIIYLFYECKTMMDYSASIYTVSTAIACTIILTILVWESSNIFKLIENFEMFIKKRVTDSIKQPIYEDTNASIEKWTALMDFFMVKFTVPFAVTLSFIFIIVTYYTSGLTDEDYFLIDRFWFPFNYKMITRYSAVMFFCLVYGVWAIQIVTYTFSLLVGLCLLLRSITKHLKEDLLSMDKEWKINQNPVKLKERFGKIIENISNAVQFARDLADILKYIFTVYAIWGIVTICGSLLMLTSDEGVQINSIFVLISRMLYSVGMIFFYCEACERIIDGFDEISDTIHQLEWYTYPLEIQRMLPIIVSLAQQPVELEAFGNIPCTRDTFKKITNKGYSFFTIFRGM